MKAIEISNHLANGDFCRRAGEAVSAMLAWKALHDTLLLQLAHDLLEKLAGNLASLGNLTSRNRRVFWRGHQGKKRSEGIICFVGNSHKRQGIFYYVREIPAVNGS